MSNVHLEEMYNLSCDMSEDGHLMMEDIVDIHNHQMEEKMKKLVAIKNHRMTKGDHRRTNLLIEADLMITLNKKDHMTEEEGKD